MEKSLIVNLIKEVNSAVKNKSLSEMLVSKANSYHQEGLSESEIFAKVLADVSGLNQAIKNTAVTQIVENYNKFKVAEKFTMRNLANEAGLFKLLTGIRASNAFADPVIKTTVTKLEEALAQYPEFRVIPTFIELLKPFSYEPSVKQAIQEAHTYMSKNGTKLILLNSIFEFSIVPSNVYKNTITILEQALLDNEYSVDSLKMKLRESLEVPTIKRMISNLSLVESKANNGFNLGIGSNRTSVDSSILPVIKVNEGIITILNNRFVQISEKETKYLEPKFVFENHGDFYSFVQNFVNLKFTSTNEGIRTKFRNTEVEFKNEGAGVSTYINKKKIEDLKKVNYSEIFIMENVNSRKSIAHVFENTQYMKSLDFIKKISTPDKSCQTVQVGGKLFILENDNSGQIIEATPAQFVKYLKENYDYDTTPMFDDQIESEGQEIHSIDTQKEHVDGEIKELEHALSDLDSSTAGVEDEDVLEKAHDLRFAIEKNINSLKEKYIQLENQKKALLEHNIISSTKKYNLDDQVQTIDGRFGKVRGVDGSTSRYMVAFEDGKIRPVQESELL